jgi:hypothetical protein
MPRFIFRRSATPMNDFKESRTRGPVPRSRKSGYALLGMTIFSRNQCFGIVQQFHSSSEKGSGMMAYGTTYGFRP